MRTLLLSLISSALVASCATQSPNPWQGLEVETQRAAIPLDCLRFPLPSETIGDTVVYDVSGLNALNAYRQCSEANEAIAYEHAQQIDQLKIARKALVEAGRAQRNIADMKEQMLMDERRYHFFQSIGLYMVIIGMGLAL